MVKKWEIWFLNLDPTTGSKQRRIRPVLVISNDAVNDNLTIFTCIPFSSYKIGNIRCLFQRHFFWFASDC